MLAITGMVLATVETYWQTTLLQYLPQDLKWLLGCTNCFAYIGVLIGNYICTRMYTNKTLLPLTNIQYYLLKLLLPLPLLAISLSGKWLWFVLFYLLLYIALGFVNLIENTLIHTNVKSSQRASILSMYSLFSMGGGFAASLITSLILKEYTLACVWSTISVISILSTVLICLAVNKRISGKDLHMAE